MPRRALNPYNNLRPMLRQCFATRSHLSVRHRSYYHMLKQILLLLLPLLFSTFAWAANNNEALALYSWLHSSGTPPPPALASWNKPSDADPCGWSYVTCSPQNFVTEIDIQSIELALPFPSNLSLFPYLRKLVISGANLTGSIPPDIGDCTELTTLDVSSNSLVGTMPPSVGRLRNLQDLILNSNQLTGEIPAEIGSCTSLRKLVVFDNYLSGDIPVEVGKLSKLEVLRAGGNKDIAGNIPDEIGECLNLKVLGLADTKISGSIPASVGKLNQLQTFSVYTTMLSGEIPPEIGNCSELVELFLYENNLSGPLPATLGKLPKLEKLLLWQNGFHGTIPEQIGGCESLAILDLSLNSLSGSIPWSLGNLSYLEELMLSNNNITGSIPVSLSNATSLVQLQLDTNQISGPIPREIGKLTKLTVFFAWQNSLEGSIPSTLVDCKGLEVLDLSHNALTGSLPPELFQLQNLTKILLISNDISGSLPPEIGNCGSLVRFRLANNKVGGEIPKEFGLLNNLSFLDLSENHFRGLIPEEIGNCTALQMLNLSNNSLGGALPNSLSSLTKLQVLDVSLNRLTAQIPPSFGQLSSLSSLSLRQNLLSGPIPSWLKGCSNLQMLDLSGNGFSGTIPVELFQIKSLEIALNLSWNLLSGMIPPQISALNKLSVLDLSHNQLGGNLLVLSELENLVSLNISYNNFTGYLPDTKLFRQLSSTDLAGNKGLCPGGREACFLGDATALSLQNRRTSKQSVMTKLAIALLSTLIVALAVFGVFAVIRVQKMGRNDDDSEIGGVKLPWQITLFQKLNFSVEQLLKCLVEENVIGKGCSGIVYRAQLENGEVIAVKKLWPTTLAAGYDCCPDKVGTEAGVRDSFSAEVRTLGMIRHKNIVRFLGCCWNRSTRLLLYDYMPNGNLGSLLHERSGNCLEWDVRYRIVLDAAQGLAYLHHDCVPPIVHRDIKANNILIGPEFEPYIADFGLAKLVGDGNFARSSNTVAGSFGYIAPEYGYMMNITEKSDVYSFGIVMLEVLTGKQPIDPTIPEGLHIVDWVRQRRGGAEVLDASLRARPQPEIEEMLQTLGVAMLCVNPSPTDRPTMKDVAALLWEIRQGREENMKMDSMLRDYGTSTAKEDEDEDDGDGSRKRPAAMMQQEAYTRSGNTASFSASSLQYSSSSHGHISFK